MSEMLPKIPDGWRPSYLEDLIFLDREKLSEGTSGNFSFYYIDISAVSEGHLRLPATKIRFRGSPSRARKVIRRGDVLMASVRPNLKAFAYFDHTNDDCIASTGFAILTANPDVDPRFILASILSDSVTAQIDSHVVGSNYPAINSKDIRRLEILAPPPAQQRKIARILTTLDNVITQTEALIAKYQAIKQGLMHDLFTRGVDATGKLRPPQSEAPELYKQSELGWIPKEWEVRTLDSAAERVIVGLALSVTQAYRDNGTPLIRNQNIRSGFFEDDEMLFLDPQFAGLFPNKRLVEGDVLTVRTGSNVGDTALAPAKYSGCLTFTTLITTPRKSALFAPFMVAYLASSSGLSELNRLLVGGGKENLNVGEFIKLRIPLPDVSEQRACISSMSSVTTTIETERVTVRNLRKIKTGLMQDLLTGKVPVKADEPEEVATHG